MTDETVSGAPVEATEQAQGTTPETVDKPAEESKPVMIPKERLDAEIAKRREFEKAAAELEALKQAQADEAAKKAGDLEKFQRERDEYKTQADRWNEYATKRLEAITADLDDDALEALAVIEDATIDKRLALAEKLAGKKKSAGFGTTGGGSPTDSGGLIPSSVQSRAQYDAWLGDIMASGDPARIMMLADQSKRKQLEAEAAKRFG